MVRLLLTGLVFLLSVRGAVAAEEKPVSLGTIEVRAWLSQPRMPPIALTRGPLQQIIDSLQSAAMRPEAATWEMALTRHRQLLLAANVALRELQRHYHHQLALHPKDARNIRLRLRQEGDKMRKRFEQAEAERAAQLRAREEVMLGRLRPTRDQRRGAASQLLLAEIQLARHQDTFRLLRRRWENQKEPDTKSARKARRPTPFLSAVVKALEQVGDLAPGRLTRERAAQLLAVVHVENRDPAKAINTLRAVLRTRVSWQLEAELLNRLADLLLDQERFAGAAKIYGQVNKLAPTWHVRAQLGQAWCRYRLSDTDGAISAVMGVRNALRGLFDQSAQELMADADRLYAQLLADRGAALPRALPARLRDAVLSLRQSKSSIPDKRAVADGRRSVVAQRIPALRRCYRTYLRSTSSQPVRVVLSFHGGEAPKVVNQTVPSATLRACLNDALSQVETLPDDLPAMLVLEFDE